jgi:hypothetical protein
MTKKKKDKQRSTSVYNSNLDFVMILPQKVINGKEVNTNQSINGGCCYGNHIRIY